MIGMRLKEYTFRINEETVDALDKYEMDEDNPRSLTLIINEFLENLMIDKGYLTIDLDEPELMHTPFEENVNPKDNFKRVKQRNGIRLYFDDLDFSSHSPEHIDEVEDKLLAYSGGEYEKLFELSKNNSNVVANKYKQELYNKFGIEYSNSKVTAKLHIYPYNGKYTVYKRINNSNYSFGTYADKKDADKVYDFLIVKPDNELIKYSFKNKGLTPQKYRDWLFQEIEKEHDNNEQSDNIQ